MTRLDLSVVLVSWRGLDAANRALRAIGATVPLTPDADVVAVLAGWVDNHRGPIELADPVTAAEILARDGIVDEALSRALSPLVSEWVLVVSDDVVLPGGWFEPVETAICDYPEAVALSPRISTGASKSLTNPPNARGGVCLIFRRDAFLAGRVDQIHAVDGVVIDVQPDLAVDRPKRAAPKRDGRIGIGVTTYNRPRFAWRCVESLFKHAGDIATIYLYDDGSTTEHGLLYRDLFEYVEKHGGVVIASSTNCGVATAKNTLFQRMLDDGCEWLFMAEDDTFITSSEAVTGYVDACVRSGLHHLSFSHSWAQVGHVPIAWTEAVEYTPAISAGWSVYSRACLENVGLMDPMFYNAMEHVEHEMRIYEAGWCGDIAAFGSFPDARESWRWVEEVETAQAGSVIRAEEGWSRLVDDAVAYWKQTYPDTYAVAYGPRTRATYDQRAAALARMSAEQYGAAPTPPAPRPPKQRRRRRT